MYTVRTKDTLIMIVLTSNDEQAMTPRRPALENFAPSASQRVIWVWRIYD